MGDGWERDSTRVFSPNIWVYGIGLCGRPRSRLHGSLPKLAISERPLQMGTWTTERAQRSLVLLRRLCGSVVSVPKITYSLHCRSFF